MGAVPSKKMESIKVEMLYQVRNGLSGMMRDVVLRLCLLLVEQDLKIRAIVGMSQEHYVWKGHTYFKMIKKRTGLTKTFVADDSEKVTLSQNRCTFKSVGLHHTVFVDFPMAAGIHRITFKILELQSKRDEATLGVCPQPKDYTYTRGFSLGYYGFHGSGGLNVMSDTTRLYYFGDVHTPNLFSSFPHTVGSAISVELNATLHTVHFFVDGKTFTYYIRKLLKKHTVFAVCGHHSPSFGISSLVRLAHTCVPSDVTLTAKTMNDYY